MSSSKLLWAIQTQELETFHKLIKDLLDSTEKIDPMIGSLLLHNAITNFNDKKPTRSLTIIEEIIKYDADINLPNEKHLTPLMRATVCERSSIVELLIRFNADQNIQDSEGNIPLHFVISDNFHLFNITKKNLNTENEEGYTPFFMALLTQQYDVAKRMMDLGADINYQNKKYGHNILFVAVSRDNLDLFDYLSQKNVNHHALDNEGNNLLVHAFGSNYMLQRLLAKEININHKNNIGNTVLHLAASNSNVDEDEIDSLIRNGADLNIKNNNNAYPLSLAILNQSFNAIKTLRLALSDDEVKKQLNIC